MENNLNSSNGSKEVDLSLKQILSGNVLTREAIKKHIWYVLFLVLLSIVYINNKYKTESLLISIVKLQNEVKEVRDRSVSYAADLMSISRESEVIKIVDEKKMNLQELKLPPEKIEIKK
jgi:hypothetical protein